MCPDPNTPNTHLIVRLVKVELLFQLGHFRFQAFDPGFRGGLRRCEGRHCLRGVKALLFVGRIHSPEITELRARLDSRCYGPPSITSHTKANSGSTDHPVFEKSPLVGRYRHERGRNPTRYPPFGELRWDSLVVASRCEKSSLVIARPVQRPTPHTRAQPQHKPTTQAYASCV